MNFLITGLIVGIVSLIPGISGGTIIMLSSKYQEILEGIAKLNFKIISKLIWGVVIGSLLIANIIEYLFATIPVETMYFFIGLLIFSLPKLIKQEYKCFSFPFLLIGMSIIYVIFTLTPSHSLIITKFPNITPMFLLIFMLCGTLDGFLTILPGISGSLVMMILGPYYLYKSYLANISFLNLIPLIFYFIGDLLGVLLGSKLSIILLKKYHKATISILAGMLIMSIVLLIPKVNYTPTLILGSFTAMVISLVIILLLKTLKKSA